jgi:hypothetical protein
VVLRPAVVVRAAEGVAAASVAAVLPQVWAEVVAAGVAVCGRRAEETIVPERAAAQIGAVERETPLPAQGTGTGLDSVIAMAMASSDTTLMRLEVITTRVSVTWCADVC